MQMEFVSDNGITLAAQCSAADIVGTYDTLAQSAPEHDSKANWTCFIWDTPYTTARVIRSRAELLDMIYVVNAYSIRHNGSKIYM